MFAPTGFSWRPALASVRPRVMAQIVSPRDATPAIRAFGHTISLGLAAAGVWVGFDTGARRTGLLSALGYMIGVGSAFAGVVDVAALAILGFKAVAGATTKAPTANEPWY